MAANLLETGAMFHRHHGVANHSYQFPVYAFLVAGIYKSLGFHPRLIVVLNLALNALNAWILIELLGGLFDRLAVSDRFKSWKHAIVAVSIIGFLLHPLISFYSMNNV